MHDLESTPLVTPEMRRRHKNLRLVMFFITAGIVTTAMVLILIGVAIRESVQGG